MPLPPSNLFVVTLTGGYVTSDGQLAEGTVTIRGSLYVQDGQDNAIVAPAVITKTLVNGTFSVPLYANTDPDGNPANGTYTITEKIKNATPRTYSIQIPHTAGSTLDLADVAPVVPGPPVSSYVLTSQLGMPNGVATLGADGLLTVGQRPPGGAGGNATYQGMTVDIGEALSIAISTGVMFGGRLTVNADPSKVNITAIRGYIMNYHTDPTFPVMVRIDQAARVGVSMDAGALSRLITYWVIDATGTLIQRATLPTRSERRSLLLLAGTAQIGGSIFAAAVITDQLPQPNNQLFDLMRSLGPFLVSGHVLTGNAGLTFQRSAGEVFSTGANQINDLADPHVVANLAMNPVSFRYNTQTAGSPGPVVTAVDPLNYDVADVITAIPGSTNRATIQRVYYLPASGVTGVQYGQQFYNSLAEAVSALGTETFVANADLTLGVLIGAIVLTKGCTNLNDPNTARFFTFAKFAGAGAGSGQLPVGTTAGTVAAGDDSRIVGAMQKSANLSDVTSVALSRTNLGLGGAAVLSVGQVGGTVAAGDDPRFTDSRTPLAHAASHSAAGSDPITITQTQVSGLPAVLSAKADLVGGVIPTSQIPAIAITETFVVASQAAMLALAAQRGDVAIRTDITKTFILSTDSPGTLADWKEVLTAAGAVTSVNGQTGAVTLGAADVGAAPETRSINTNAPLTGGGNLTGDRTLGVTFGTTSNTITEGNDTRVVNAVQTSRTISTTAPLTGGGDLTANRTLGISVGTAANTVAAGNDTRLGNEHAGRASGLKAWSIDPAGLGSGGTKIGGGGSGTAGRASVMKVYLNCPTETLTGISVEVVGALGAGLSNAYAALYNSAGTQVAVSADVSATLVASTGTKLLPFTSAVVNPAVGEYYIYLLVGTATTMPLIVSGSGAPNANGLLGSGATPRYSVHGTGLSAAPASFNPATDLTMITGGGSNILAAGIY